MFCQLSFHTDEELRLHLTGEHPQQVGDFYFKMGYRKMQAQVYKLKIEN